VAARRISASNFDIQYDHIIPFSMGGATTVENLQILCATCLLSAYSTKFHAQRGDAPLNYTDLKDLINIIRANWEAFEPFFPSAEWAASVLDSLERSRNVIMHSGSLGPRDVERVGIHLRDWITQVGT
jgi:hypothetical protein